MMITEICANIRNWFTEDKDKHFGEYKISGGKITPSDFLQNGQYFRIIGSRSNDGVYKYPCPELTDEIFEGAVWAMNVPPAFVALCTDIEAYQKSEAAAPSTMQSESFAGYSYTRMKDENGSPMGWQGVFRSRLNQWRKMG